jgi:hypothetical protein
MPKTQRLIANLVVLAGMRPGEIFGLKWEPLGSDYDNIRWRVYRGDVDSPKPVGRTDSLRFPTGCFISTPRRSSQSSGNKVGMCFRFESSIFN